MTCLNCEALREQVINLERQMGNRFPKGAIAAVSDRFGTSMRQSRLLLTIYYREDWTSSEYITRHLDMDDAVRRTTIYRLRGVLGPGVIESGYGLGYRMTDVGRAKLKEVLA